MTIRTLPAAAPGGASQIERWLDRGHADQLAGHPEKAAVAFRRVLERDPANFDALQLLGLAQIQSGRAEDGILWLRRAIAVRPADAAVHNNLGNALLSLGRRLEAIEALAAASRLEPGNPTPAVNLANAQLELGQKDAALATLSAVLGRVPRHVEANVSLGLALRAAGRTEAARAALERALALEPRHPRALAQHGLVCIDLGDVSAAYESLRAARAVAPPALQAWTLLLAAQVGLESAEWSDWTAACAAIGGAAAADPGSEAIDPLRAMLFPADDAALYAVTRQFARRTIAPGAVRPQTPARRREDPRIRLAYLSPDFGDHPVMRLLAPVLETHDRNRFTVTAYGWGKGAGTPHRERIRAGVDRFVDLEGLSDTEAAGLMRRDDIDLAIDLAGYTRDARPRLLLERIAPVQAGWLGYPGTLGTHGLDYLIADDVSIPATAAGYFSEQIVRVPGTFLPYDPAIRVDPAPARATYGLPEDGVVLACFAQTRKLNPILFDAWMAALAAAPSAVLWLSTSEVAAIDNLRRAAEARGVPGERLHFVPRAPDQSTYLARYALADLVLDTYPYGSHSTAMDVLWAGSPLLALAGPSMASRVSSSVLLAAGLADLVAHGLEAYGRTLQDLVRDPPKLAALRVAVTEARSRSPLFDLPRFTAHLEAAYTAMHQTALAGHSPASFSIAAADRRERSTGALDSDP